MEDHRRAMQSSYSMPISVAGFDQTHSHSHAHAHAHSHLQAHPRSHSHAHPHAIPFSPSFGHSPAISGSSHTKGAFVASQSSSYIESSFHSGVDESRTPNAQIRAATSAGFSVPVSKPMQTQRTPMHSMTHEAATLDATRQTGDSISVSSSYRPNGVFDSGEHNGDLGQNLGSLQVHNGDGLSVSHLHSVTETPHNSQIAQASPRFDFRLVNFSARRSKRCCSNCGTSNTRQFYYGPNGEPLCDPCGQWYRRHHAMRPEHLWSKGGFPNPLGTDPNQAVVNFSGQVRISVGPKIRLCSNCGPVENGKFCRGPDNTMLCGACHQWYRRHKDMRPEHLWKKKKITPEGVNESNLITPPDRVRASSSKDYAKTDARSAAKNPHESVLNLQRSMAPSSMGVQQQQQSSHMATADYVSIDPGTLSKKANMVAAHIASILA